MIDSVHISVLWNESAYGVYLMQFVRHADDYSVAISGILLIITGLSV